MKLSPNDFHFFIQDNSFGKVQTISEQSNETYFRIKKCTDKVEFYLITKKNNSSRSNLRSKRPWTIHFKDFNKPKMLKLVMVVRFQARANFAANFS